MFAWNLQLNASKDGLKPDWPLLWSMMAFPFCLARLLHIYTDPFWTSIKATA
jgi:hypothetical protein